MSDEKDSIDYTAKKAWAWYNPKWLLDKVDEAMNDKPQSITDDPIFNLADVREAYYAGFKAGVVYKITKEIPNEGEKPL